jgi:hypothetical protein
MYIDKLNKEFNELIKKFDEKKITEWLEQKRLEEQEEKQNKRSEQLFCGTCNKFEVCKDLCEETDPCCKIYREK